MTANHTTTRISCVPLLTGLSLWAAATALLLEDAYRANNWDVQHLAVPILTASTCVAGVLAHKKLASFKLLTGTALLMLALLGSALCIFNVIGRTAADRDHKVAVAMAGNRVLGERHEELTRARQEMAKECRVRGAKCAGWEQRVDQLQRETSSMLARSLDPRADAIARLATLVGLDGDKAKEIVAAIDPAALPIFLELGAIMLLAVSFPTRKPAMVVSSQTIAEQETAIEPQPFTRAQALQDIKRMREAGSGRYLAQRWNVDPATASRWLQAFEQSGAIIRNRDGKSKAIAVIRSPRKLLAKV